MNYGQFLNMIPEASLVAILIIVFIADFCSSHSANRKWFNPFVAVLLLVQTVICAMTLEPAETFAGLYVSSKAAGAMKLMLTGGTLIVTFIAKP